MCCCTCSSSYVLENNTAALCNASQAPWTCINRIWDTHGASVTACYIDLNSALKKGFCGQHKRRHVEIDIRVFEAF